MTFGGTGKTAGVAQTLLAWLAESKVPPEKVDENHDGTIDTKKVVSFILKNYHENKLKEFPELQKKFDQLLVQLDSIGIDPVEAERLLLQDAASASRRLVELGRGFEKKADLAPKNTKPQQQAKTAYENALWLDPNNIEAKHGLSACLLREARANGSPGDDGESIVKGIADAAEPGSMPELPKKSGPPPAPEIIGGDVDLAAPFPIWYRPPRTGFGETAMLTTQGEFYKPNEDVMAWVEGPRGEEYLIALDGIGGEASGSTAARLTAEALAAELQRSGDPAKAWQLANFAVGCFNAKLKQQREVPLEEPPDTPTYYRWIGILRGATPQEVRNAEAAARDFIRQPSTAGKGMTSGGSGAVGVSVGIFPPTTPDGAHLVQFHWVGDARAKQIRREPEGKWHEIYSTVDDGVPSMPGQLVAGEDFAEGGAGRTLAGQIHPEAHVVTNALGGRSDFSLRNTSEGELPNAAEPSGHSLAGRPFQDGVVLRPGDLLIFGSDGFWENFGSTEEILVLIRDVQNAQDAAQILSTEAHRRMRILGHAREFLREKYGALQRIPFTYEGELHLQVRLEDQIELRAHENNRPLYIDRDGGVYLEKGDEHPVNHFKTDNFSLGVYLHNPTSISPGT